MMADSFLSPSEREDRKLKPSHFDLVNVPLLWRDTIAMATNIEENISLWLVYRVEV